MYPFERFTEKAKKVLTLAQDEAEKAHLSYIGSEQLLLGLLREEDGLAARVLDNLGVEIERVRETIDSVRGRNERVFIQQSIPTSRVKKVIEIAFEEAKRMNNTYVGTEHLLLGLLIEGEGVAAHVLDDMGANLDKVRPELDSLLQGQRLPDELPAGLRPRRSRQGGSPQVAGHFVHSVFHDLGQFTSEANSAMALAEEEAAKAGLGYLGTEHLLLGLIRQSEGVAAQALGNLGVTLAGVRLELASEQRDLRHLAVPQLNPSRRFVKAVTSLAPLEVANLPTHLLDTQHLLLAITADGDDPAARVLAALGVSASALREEVQRLEGDSAA